MDIERVLISRCVSAGEVNKLVARGISPHHFESEEHRNVFTTVINHMLQYGAPPSADAILLAHPGYKFEPSSDTFDYLTDVFVKRIQKRIGQRELLDISDRINNAMDGADIDMLFMQACERVAEAVPSSRISKLSDVKSRMDLYAEMKLIGRIPGIPFGIPTIDNICLGVQNHELCVVTAPSSHGKSTMLQYIALSCYLDGHKPIFISLEMDGDSLLRKFDTMATNFSYSALRALDLGEGDMKKWEQWGERCANAANDIIIIDDISECTVSRVLAENLRWKPSATFVDYFGIMTPENSGRDAKAHESMANMAKALKRIPKRTGIPLFTAAQTNRDGFKNGVRADNVADTIEIFRSADIMIGLNWDEEETPNTMTVKLVKNRDGKKGEVDLSWNLETMDISERSRFAGAKRQIIPTTEEVLALAAAEPAALAHNPFAALNGGN